MPASRLLPDQTRATTPAETLPASPRTGRRRRGGLGVGALVAPLVILAALVVLLQVVAGR